MKLNPYAAFVKCVHPKPTEIVIFDDPNLEELGLALCWSDKWWRPRHDGRIERLGGPPPEEWVTERLASRAELPAALRRLDYPPFDEARLPPAGQATHIAGPFAGRPARWYVLRLDGEVLPAYRTVRNLVYAIDGGDHVKLLAPAMYQLVRVADREALERFVTLPSLAPNPTPASTTDDFFDY